STAGQEGPAGQAAPLPLADALLLLGPIDLFHQEWERCGWDHAGDVQGQQRAKVALLRWRLHALLADLTGDLIHYYETVLARPDLSMSHASLCCALARVGRTGEGVPHLRQAVESDPFDFAAARALFQALTDTRRNDEAARLVDQCRRLHLAAPTLVKAEPW